MCLAASQRKTYLERARIDSESAQGRTVATAAARAVIRAVCKDVLAGGRRVLSGFAHRRPPIARLPTARYQDTLTSSQQVLLLRSSARHASCFTGALPHQRGPTVRAYSGGCEVGRTSMGDARAGAGADVASIRER